ncbi:hypothetical protein VP01_414g4 [Puccinia sorghi]|uniref:DDE Tnp4 domain-containing protein n=1 Tax=Puccinia sorghi TaxID=27349 RepID=A0A0L6UR16_9BASI|nr:hypothetical protein VP01_414g4 [Puccinia sorghi]
MTRRKGERNKKKGRVENSTTDTIIKLISFPSLDQPDKWCETMPSFERWQGIPRIVGVIIGTHIHILMPPDGNWKLYVNRKSWASIVFQCVVDGDGNFCDVQVFRCSPLGQSLQNNK